MVRSGLWRHLFLRSACVFVGEGGLAEVTVLLLSFLLLEPLNLWLFWCLLINWMPGDVCPFRSITRPTYRCRNVLHPLSQYLMSACCAPGSLLGVGRQRPAKQNSGFHRGDNIFDRMYSEAEILHSSRSEEERGKK